MHLKKIIFRKTAGLLTLMTVVISGFYVVFTIERNRELTKNLWITRSQLMADAAQRLLLWDDRVAIKEQLDREVRGSDALAYAFITKEGEPYVSTFARGVPAALIGKSPASEQPYVWKFQNTAGMVMYDISTRIGQPGTVLHLGLKRRAIDRKLEPLLASIGGVGLAVMFAGVLMALMLARRTTREVDTLVEALRSYGELNEKDELAINPKSSEVTELVRSFKALTAERKQAEQELLNLNLQLEQRVTERTEQLASSNRELDAFAYSVSHDLRAPLRGIDGFSLALMDDYGDGLNDAAKDYLRRIRNGCGRMGELIDVILRLSRITRGEIHLMPVNLGEMAHQVAEELRQGEPSRSVEFVIHPVEDVHVDPAMFRSVLDNLLGNAWKYSRNKTDARIEFGSVRNAGEINFYIKDNGAGFNMEYANKLFTPFQRLHRSDEFEGLGIGLASVQRIVLRHGGRVWANGEEGKGATFYFALGESIS